MLRTRIRWWFLRRLGLKIYAVSHTVSDREFEMLGLNSSERIRFEKIIKQKLSRALAEKLPIIFITTNEPANMHVKISAYIYALEIKK